MKKLFLLILAVSLAFAQVDLVKQTKGTLPVSKGGTNATTAAGARTALGAAASGANSDITSLIAAEVYDKGGVGHNVKAYGAVGDGVADDTAAFNAAMAAGKHILVPPGTYKITSTLTPPAGTVARRLQRGSLGEFLLRRHHVAAARRDRVCAGRCAAADGHGTDLRPGYQSQSQDRPSGASRACGGGRDRLAPPPPGKRDMMWPTVWQRDSLIGCAARFVDRLRRTAPLYA